MEKITDITEEMVFSLIPHRIEDSHKGTYGKVLAVCGSVRFRGAAALCTEGALRSGCGIVSLATVEEVFGSVQARLPEAILIACSKGSNGFGGISGTEAGPLSAELAKDYTALVIGPGMGNSPDTAELVRAVVGGADERVTAVIDADGLNALTGGGFGDADDAAVVSGVSPESADTADIKKLPATGSFKNIIPGTCRRIITPHPGEMARLAGCSIAQVKADRERIAVEFALANNCVVVLKDHRTLVAAPDGRLFRNTSGNSGLARGGSGDILAGMIASLAAQGMDALDAAIAGVWLHGRAAELCSARLSETAMLPHDIFTDLGTLMLAHGR